MPPGRPTNHEKKIATLLGQLKAALVARARQRIEAQVDEQVAGLVGGVVEAVEVAAPVPAPAKGKRTRSAASLAAQAAKMRAVWARKKGAPLVAAGGLDGFGIKRGPTKGQGRAGRANAPAVGAATSAKAQRGPGKNNPKLKSALRNSWASYTPAQRKARVAAMLKGRGLKPKRG